MATRLAYLTGLSLVALLGLGRPAVAQTDAAEQTILRGVVVGEDDKPVAEAVVQGTGAKVAADPQTTDAEGRFAVQMGHAANGWIYGSFRAETSDGRLGFLSIAQAKPEPVRLVVKPARKLTILVQDGAGRAVEGAAVQFLSNMQPLSSGATNAAGTFSCLVPADATDWSLFARKSHVGFDYAVAQRGRGSLEQPHPLPERITLTLDGARTVRFQAIDQAGQPVAGVQIGPWTIRKPGRESDINLSGSSAWWPATGQDGTLVLDWLPAKFEQSLSFINRVEGYYAPEHAVRISADKPADELTIQLLPLEKLSGRVTHGDGRPAAGMTVMARGQGTTHHGFHGGTKTDGDGRYELDVYSEQAYLVVAGDETWASPIRSDIVVRAGEPVEGIDLVLVPATRVHGRLTVGKDARPVSNAYIGAITDFGEITDALPRKPDDRTYFSLQLSRSAPTDADGRYQFFLGPGEHTIRGPAHTEPVKITIAAADARAEIEQDFHMPRAETGPLAGRVVDRNGKPVPDAVVQGRYASSQARRWFHDVQTDEKGSFQVERSLDPLVLFARTADGELAGIARSDAEATKVEVVVGPVASATGRLKDREGNVLADKSLSYGIRIYEGEPGRGPFMDSFGGGVTTDANGEFKLQDLVPGEEYEVGIKIDEHLSRGVTQVTAKDAAPVTLGDLAVDPNPSKPYVPPTPAERAAKAFAAHRDTPPDERLTNLLAEARREYTRPLLLFGKPDDAACVELFRLLEERDSAGDVKEGPEADYASPNELRWEFELAALDVGRPEIRTLAASRKIDLAKGPVLAVLDREGNVVETHPVARKDEKLDARVLGAWMAKHKLPTRNAARMLDAALAKAKAEDKRVFFILSASWCGPCRMLARFLAPHKPDLEKHFVFVKLDVSRDEQAEELKERFKESQTSGVPWYCILEADGKVLASSNLPKVNPRYGTSNMGFPTLPPEIEHFVGMLKAGAPRLADEKLAEYKAELLKKK